MHYMLVKLFMLVDCGMLHVDAGIYVNINASKVACDMSRKFELRREWLHEYFLYVKFYKLPVAKVSYTWHISNAARGLGCIGMK